MIVWRVGLVHDGEEWGFYNGEESGAGPCEEGGMMERRVGLVSDGEDS